MRQFDKSVDLYLRGFNSQYIRRRTGNSKQSIVRELASKGFKYSKSDMIEYQVQYIRDKYTDLEIKDAYSSMLLRYDNPYKASRKSSIVMLGCGFGNISVVLSNVMGDLEYKDMLKRTNPMKDNDIV